MPAFTGEFDGYTYQADWIRTSANAIHVSSKVRGPSGMLCGTPTGTLYHGSETDEQLDSAARLFVEAAIRDSVQVERESDD